MREDEAEVVRLIFDLYANKNMGVQRIGEYLTEHGIFTRQGKPFSGRSLFNHTAEYHLYRARCPQQVYNRLDI